MGKPDFLILGVQRAGTTSLAHCFIHHPGIAPPVCQYPVHGSVKGHVHVLSSDGIYIGRFSGPDEVPIKLPWTVGAFMKECSYFSRFYEMMSFKDYCSFFDNNGTGKLSFEASPEYLTMKEVAGRVKNDCPDARFIVLLRNPITRAWSHYWHEVAINRTEKLPFREAIERGTTCFCDEYFYSYISRGHYADHLERWFSLFPRDRFKIYFMEEFFSDVSHFNDLQQWLGLEYTELTGYPQETTLSAGYPPMEDNIEGYLYGYYKPHNARLEKLLGRELPW